jgi:hypothetical protein
VMDIKKQYPSVERFGIQGYVHVSRLLLESKGSVLLPLWMSCICQPLDVVLCLLSGHKWQW